MAWGTLVRVVKHRADRSGIISYIVAVPDPAEATDLIRRYCAEPGDAIQNLGRVSEELLQSLQLLPNQYVRVDQAGKR
jgi:hypothetical protein